MNNRTKIIIGILIVVTIIIAIVGIIGNLKKEDKNENKEEFSEIYNYLNETNEIVENEIDNNEEVNENENNTVNNNATNTPIIGKEEQESKKEADNMVDYEQKAIEMAKKEWGISVESYDFVAKRESNTVYTVTVEEQNGNKYRLATYTIDVIAGTVVEK
ncbi:MAG: hypothetical protein HFJ59_07650 [Clostridia bacterium]|nr:hypothetical protein [Clostridia bacterium]